VVALIVVVVWVQVVVLVAVDVVIWPYSMNAAEAKTIVKMTNTPSNTSLVFTTCQNTVHIGSIYGYCAEHLWYGL